MKPKAAAEALPPERMYMSDKKESKKKGLHGVTFLGHTLRFTEINLEEFEREAYRELVRIGRIPEGSLIDCDGIMTNFIKNRSILRLALYYSLKNECPDLVPITAKTEEERWQQINDLIASARDAGIENTQLIRLLLEAYMLATNPSTVASTKASWSILDQQAKAEQELQNARRIQAANLSMAAMKKIQNIIAEASKPPDLPTSNSD